MSVFSKEELVRYHRQIILPELGIGGQERIKQAKVLVVGAGGLGCPLLLYLAGAGVGTIGIVDFDTVEASNLHRQIIYKNEDIGKKKVAVAVAVVSGMNPHIKVQEHDVMLEEKNAEEIISGYDIVCDGTDNFLTRYLVNDVCVKLKKPLVYGSVLRFEGQLAVFNLNGSKNLRDLFPEAPAPEDVPSCSEAGVLGVIPGIIGSMMGEKCLLIILGKDPGLNKLLIYRTFGEAFTLLKF